MSIAITITILWYTLVDLHIVMEIVVTTPNNSTTNTTRVLVVVYHLTCLKVERSTS